MTCPGRNLSQFVLYNLLNVVVTGENQIKGQLGELGGGSAHGRRPGAVRGWPLWSLAPGLRGYVIVVIVAGTAAVAVAAALTTWRVHDAITCSVLLAIGAVSVESVRRDFQAL